MRDEGFRRAMNTVGPTPEQKERMRAYLESQLPQKERQRYLGRPEKGKRLSWLPAVAALLAVVVGGGLALMKETLPTSQKPNVSAVESMGNAETSSLETLLSSPEYRARLAMKRDDTDQLNALARQYGLTVETEGADTDGWELASQVGIRRDVRGGRYYSATGSSSFDGVMSMENADWIYPIRYRVCYNAKGAVVPELPVLDDAEAYRVWSYVTSDGASLVLALSLDNAVIYGQTVDGFYVVYTESNRGWDEAKREHNMEQKDLEAFAETFLFPMNTAEQISEGLEALYASPEYQAKKQAYQKLLAQGDQADIQETADAYGLKWDEELTVGQLNDYIRDTDSRPVQHSMKDGGKDSYGSYCYVGTTTMDYSGSPWPYPIEYKFCVNPKGVLFIGLPEIGEPDSYTQWSYTNSDGVELTLGLRPEHAVIYGPASGGFYVVSVSVNQEEADRPMDQKALEAFAETFRFPQNARGILAAGEEQYAAILAGYKDVMGGGSGKWQKNTAEAIRVRGEKFFGYAFRDLDGDGSDELLMTGGSNVYAVYAGRGEQAHAILKDDGVTQYELCQDGTILQKEDYALKVYRVEEGTLATIENVQVQSDPSSPWVRITENGPTAISQEEYRQVRNSYHSDTIPFTPLYAWKGYKEYVENRLLGTVDPDTLDPAYAAIIEDYRQAITQGMQPAEFAELDISLGIASVEDPMNTVGFCLRDLDGDGEAELIITDGSILYGLYTLEDGLAKPIVLSWNRCYYYLCEDGYLYAEGSSSAAGTVYEFYLLQRKNLVTAETLMTDYSADPESPWFRGGTGADDVLKPITEEEFNQALSAHGEIQKGLSFVPLSQQ